MITQSKRLAGLASLPIAAAILLATCCTVAGAADDSEKQLATASTATTLQLTDEQFDMMHKMVDDIHRDLGHIDEEMNRHEEIANYPWYSDMGYGWYPGLYDSFGGMGYGGFIGDPYTEGPSLPPRQDVLQRWMGSLNGSIQALSQHVQAVQLPTGTPDDITVQMRVLQGIVPSLQGDYTKLTALLNPPANPASNNSSNNGNNNYDRQAIARETERIKDDLGGIDILRKRIHRLLKDDK